MSLWYLNICLFKGAIHFSNDPNQIVELKRVGEEFYKLMGEGVIKPIKYEEIPLESVKEKLISLRENKVGTKLVVVNK
jgi:hypothetical protein